MKGRMTEKQAQALRIKEACCALAKEHGEESVESGLPVTMVELPGLEFWITSWGANRYNLDIWSGGEDGVKVMNLTWAGEGNEDVRIVSFKRGAWEEELLGRVEPPLPLS